MVDIDQDDEIEQEPQSMLQEVHDSFTPVETLVAQPVEAMQDSEQVVNDRRSTFTFTLDASVSENIFENEELHKQEDSGISFETSPTEEATLTNFFRSPVKSSPADHSTLLAELSYPELPNGDDQTVESEIDAEPVDASHDAENGIILESLDEMEASEEVESEQQEMDNMETITTDIEAAPSIMEASTTEDDIAYPELPISAAETSLPSPVTEGDRDAHEDLEMSDSSSDLGDGYEGLASNTDNDANADSITSTETEEEFTEASLQLDIQKEYQETLENNQSTPLKAQEQSEDIVPELEEEQLDHIPNSIVAQEATAGSESVLVEAEMVEVETPGDLSAAQLLSPITKPISPSPQKATDQILTEDITDGLTLSFTPVNPRSAEPTPRRLHSPPPPPRPESGPDDVTMTVAIDEDTAILKDFLSRAAASKAERAAVVTHRRESIQNRRDSDVVRHALASPRKVLEEKDPNSPSKYDNDATLDLSQTLTLTAPDETLDSPTMKGTDEEKSIRNSRRSSRTKKSRLPAPASAAQAQASKIAIRRADGNEVVVLKKNNDVQELASLTRSNTRKNKQGAFGVTVRLLKVAMDASSLPPIDDSTRELVIGKNIRWDEQLTYYQENPETLAEVESLATPDELGGPDSSSSSKAKVKTSKSSTPKVRRVRGLGTVNGTPGKGLLAPAALLPEAVQEDQETSLPPPQQLPRPRANKIKKMPVASTSIDSAVSSTVTDSKLPTLDVAPVGVQPAVQRKSRLAAPKKVMLPQSVTSIGAEGKENAQRPGISDATPKKSIPAPKVIVPPTAGVESGLPRRRGRKML